MSKPRCCPFSRLREKVPQADEGLLILLSKVAGSRLSPE
jgi:hypothetical protein